MSVGKGDRLAFVLTSNMSMLRKIFCIIIKKKKKKKKKMLSAAAGS